MDIFPTDSQLFPIFMALCLTFYLICDWSKFRACFKDTSLGESYVVRCYDVPSQVSEKKSN